MTPALLQGRPLYEQLSSTYVLSENQREGLAFLLLLFFSREKKRRDWSRDGHSISVWQSVWPLVARGLRVRSCVACEVSSCSRESCA